MARKHRTGNRLERLRAEAAITEREREVKRKAKEAAAARAPARPTKRRKAAAASSGPVRMMAVWAVCNTRGDAVQTFRYPEKAAAEAACKELSESTGKGHSVQSKKVPFVPL